MAEDLKNKKALLYISAGMMEVTWLYALSGILFLMMNFPIFPIWTALLAFFIPMLISSILKGRGKRMIEHVFLHLCFYLTILLYTVYLYGNWQEPFLNFTWLEMILHRQYGSMDGFAYLLVLFWFSFFWINGYKLANRSNDYLMITSRFDLGIVALIFTFIILGSMNVSFPRSGILITYYFLFSMFAIALAKNLRSSKTKYSYQLSRTSLVLIFILVVLLIGSWVVLFFLPQLTSAAQAGYHILKIVARPIGNLLLKILSLLFGFGSRAVDVGPTYSSESGIPLTENTEPAWFAQLLKWLITWGGLFILSLLAMIAIGWLLWLLWKWFSARTDLDTEKKGFFEELLLWMMHLFSLSQNILNKMSDILRNILRKPENISVLFQQLCRWGRSSGIPRKKSETPQEYGRHLAHFFPDNQNDIQLIIDGFNQKMYGKKSIQAEQLEKAKKAWQRLSSPSQWPLRLLVKIFYSRKSNVREAASSSYSS